MVSSMVYGGWDIVEQFTPVVELLFNVMLACRVTVDHQVVSDILILELGRAH